MFIRQKSAFSTNRISKYYLILNKYSTMTVKGGRNEKRASENKRRKKKLIRMQRKAKITDADKRGFFFTT